MQRVMDFLLSIFGIFILLPLYACLAILVFADDGGPIFFSQVRIGKFGRTFKLWKFRSMSVDESGSNLGTVDEKKGMEESHKAYVRTQRNDPRITRLGRVMRKYHLDELPQLYNVLLGEMSLVGPRPDTPVQQFEYRAGDWALRCKVVPGVTGLSQIFSKSKRYKPVTRTALDILYVRRRGVCMYLWILGMTCRHVLRGPSS
ncbi:sugar transferase [Luminiphilus sp.]|nr:sugar transferase [Luminiphilus sp.]